MTAASIAFQEGWWNSRLRKNTAILRTGFQFNPGIRGSRGAYMRIAAEKYPITDREVFAWLSFSKRNLFIWRNAGIIPYPKIDMAVRFRRADFEKALADSIQRHASHEPVTCCHHYPPDRARSQGQRQGGDCEQGQPQGIRNR